MLRTKRERIEITDPNTIEEILKEERFKNPGVRQHQT